MRATLATLAFAVSASAASAMSLSSGDFADNAAIPPLHYYPRCGGENLSPQLSWKGVPRAARSLMLTMIDLDVPPNLWSHWIVVGLPAASTGLARGAKLPDGAHAIVSNFGDAFYDGPCPPEGSGTHRYRITLWALPVADPHFAPNAPAKDLQAVLTGLAIDHASITGTVRR